MKTKKIKKLLSLNKKTIAGLNDNEKSDVLGGVGSDYCSIHCYISYHPSHCEGPILR